jgi:hypothetical protein
MEHATNEAIDKNTTSADGALRPPAMLRYQVKNFTTPTLTAVSASLARLRKEIEDIAEDSSESGTLGVWADELRLAVRVLSHERDELLGSLRADR